VSSVPGAKSLFDGTPSAIRWQTKGHAINGNPLQYIFEYDNKYQLKKATFGTVTRGTNNCDGGYNYYYHFTASTNYLVDNLVYDVNGNILSKNAAGENGVGTDNFQYNYIPNTNKLASVQSGTSTFYAQYDYNEIGELKQQIKGSITTNITYDAYGLTNNVVRADGKTVAAFNYDERGYRIKKTTYNLSQPAGNESFVTYYVNDISGNVLATYITNSGTVTETEFSIYGASRIGGAEKSGTSPYAYTYELTDHLGNVRATISRAKISVNNIMVADIKTWQDFFPHGSILPGRQGGIAYKHDYQGQFSEKDPETDYNSFELRMYDSKIGRWLCPDPMDQYWSPYMAMGNNPITIIDITGGTGSDGSNSSGFDGSTSGGGSDNSSGGDNQFVHHAFNGGGAKPATDPTNPSSNERPGINFNPGNTSIQTAGTWGNDGNMNEGGKDFAIPIAFPDQTAKVNQEKGLLRHVLGDKELPVGHAGVIIVDGETGETNYFDFGRYDQRNKTLGQRSSGYGVVRSSKTVPALKLPNAKIENGEIKNFNEIVSALADNKLFDGYGKMTASLYKGLEYNSMKSFARNLESKGFIKFGGYVGPGKNTNYCARFAREVISAGGGRFGPSVFTGPQNVTSTAQRNDSSVSEF
jgi:RHS repeat-associated protein